MNIDQIRKDMPYYGNKLFLNSAGSSIMPKLVTENINQYLRLEEEFGGYKVEELQEYELQGFYIEAAKLINCQPENIAFAHDATDAYIKALSSINFEKEDVIITSDDDYASNHIQFIALQKRYAIKILRIKTHENGDLDIQHFQDLVENYNPKLVAITHVPTNSGLIQNVEAIGAICQDQNILFLVDACQSVGQMEVNVQKIKCDFLSATGRKFLRGPRGTGFLFVSDRLLQGEYAPLLIDGGGAIWTGVNEFEMIETAKRFETWESPYALMIGLKEAIRYATNIGLDNIRAYNEKLMIHLREHLSNINSIKTYDRGSNNCNILTFRKDGKTLELIKDKLAENNVYFSISSKEWGLIDFNKKGIDGVIRLSPHYFNTIEEMDQVAEIIERI